jgi:hypothetical protein
MIDTERVMAYRALTVARGDSSAVLPNMDENLFASHANVTGRTMGDLLNEFMAVRENTALLFGYMNDGESGFKGSVLGHEITPRALGYIIIGHAQHHLNIVKAKYLTA